MAYPLARSAGACIMNPDCFCQAKHLLPEWDDRPGDFHGALSSNHLPNPVALMDRQHLSRPFFDRLGFADGR